ncbi:hypothetical protein BIW11_13717 [Tropilaelaps mercedesae]|uniref:Uncharacterized protein n=1 Tax=Tropilaelaps mercedesae TaxID=418985 RepID=A0A1V9X0L8_9ACAR|nr:hypothetical protein BIW11_13717 [Tropilaelaps mercedesae]
MAIRKTTFLEAASYSHVVKLFRRNTARVILVKLLSSATSYRCLASLQLIAVGRQKGPFLSTGFGPLRVPVEMLTSPLATLTVVNWRRSFGHNIEHRRSSSNR